MSSIEDFAKLLGMCPLVSDVEITEDNQLTFHVIVDDPNDADECYEKCAKVDKILMSWGISEDQLIYNDCEDCLNEGCINF